MKICIFSRVEYGHFRYFLRTPTAYPWSRFQHNVTAGSQKRAIANLGKSKGRDESRFALKLKRNLDFNCKSRSLSIFCHYWDKHCHYWDRRFVWAFSRCVENDSVVLFLQSVASPASIDMTIPIGAACYFCLGEEVDEKGKPLVRNCSCRGDSAGFAHLSCLTK